MMGRVMQRSMFARLPAKAWRWALIAGFALSAALNLPGHLPWDSVNALWEGRSHVRHTWGPRMYSAILGGFDALVPGVGLYTVGSMLLLFGAWAALPALRPRIAWAGPVLLVFWLASPEVLIFQGVVWRDVLYANLLVAGFVAVAAAVAHWPRIGPRWTLLVLAALCLSVGALVRQNGAAAIPAAALALGWSVRQEGWRRALAWIIGGLVIPLGLMAAFSFANPIHEAPDARPHANVGLRILANYDIMGALAESPDRPMPALAAVIPKGLELIRHQAREAYSPVRSDTLGGFPATSALWRPPPAVTFTQWRELVTDDPVGYARRRLEVFRWVFLTPQLDLCVPIHLGVQGPPEIEQKLGIREGHWLQDSRIYDYARRWFSTPLYSHLTYAVLALAVAIILLTRREPADIPMAALMLGALLFTASFFVVSIACDYRYLYALDLAAITGTLYVALDPPRRRMPP
jgi:hypothetical protein